VGGSDLLLSFQITRHFDFLKYIQFVHSGPNYWSLTLFRCIQFAMNVFFTYIQIVINVSEKVND
jgi:hypothetical protein